MRPISQLLAEDVAATVRAEYFKAGIVNVSTLSEAIRLRHERENIALEDIAEMVMDHAQMIGARWSSTHQQLWQMQIRSMVKSIASSRHCQLLSLSSFGERRSRRLPPLGGKHRERRNPNVFKGLHHPQFCRERRERERTVPGILVGTHILPRHPCPELP
jgi:hypothetical protein